MKNTIRTFLVDDHQIILDSLALLLAQIDFVELIGKTTDGRQALQWLQTEEVDLVITDLFMPEFSGTDLCLHIREKYPQCRVLFLTMAEDATQIREAIRAGAAGYVTKRADQVEFEHAIRTVSAGKKYYSEATVMSLSQDPTEDQNEKLPNLIASLSPREIEILRLVGQEYTTVEIADRLCLGVSTIESHRSSLMQKLHLKSGVGLGIFAATHGLLTKR
ncbi:MAG: response regulator transcription factor [Cytophagaceae bacterium]|nr:response regulator transcription factor [Cytophagaceae bacterium]